MHLKGFPENGLSELEGVKEDLDRLYRECTGRPLCPGCRMGFRVKSEKST
jgi:hypothetical protein